MRIKRKQWSGFSGSKVHPSGIWRESHVILGMRHQQSSHAPGNFGLLTRKLLILNDFRESTEIPKIVFSFSSQRRDSFCFLFELPILNFNYAMRNTCMVVKQHSNANFSGLRDKHSWLIACDSDAWRILKNIPRNKAKFLRITGCKISRQNIKLCLWM